MKVQTYENQRERSTLTQMIINTDVLARLISLFPKENPYQDGPFLSPWANLIGSWCVEYFRKYDRSPGKKIEDVLQDWALTCKDKETLGLVEAFLQSLADFPEEEEQSLEHEVDMARSYFEQVRVKRLQETLTEDVDAGDYKKGKERIISFRALPEDSSDVLDVLQDHGAIRQALDFSREPPLIDYGDSGLGMFFGDCFKKGAFIAIQASEKSGKSYWLLDFAFRAISNRKRVLYFEAGDLTQDQLVLRFLTRVCRRPFVREGDTKTLKVPTGINRVGSGDKSGVEVVQESRHFSEPLDFRTAVKMCSKFMRERVKSEEPYLKLKCCANSTLSVDVVKSTLQSQRLEGWNPDIIIIDYADIMTMPKGFKESRDQINETWKQLRGVSQDDVCLITATQADAKSYNGNLITRENFSNDKRKLSHVTDMVGLAVRPEERDTGSMRLNWVIRRGEHFNEYRACYVAGCLALANPSMVSIF